MAHKGKFYPVAQDLRLWSGDLVWPVFPPKKCEMFTVFWEGPVAHPPTSVWFECEPYNYSIGDQTLEYRSVQIGPGADLIQIGVSAHLVVPGQVRFRYGLWINDVDQVAWGYKDIGKNVLWKPGLTQSWFPAPGDFPNLIFTGFVDLRAKFW